MFSIHQNIKNNRKKKKKFVKKLATLSGVSFNTIVNIESGKNKNPTIDSLSKIARALEVKVDDLLQPVEFQPDIEKIKATQWYREGVDTVPIFIEPPWQGIVEQATQDVLIYYGKNMCYGYFDSGFMEEHGRDWVARLLKSNKPVANQKFWQEHEDKHERFIKKVETVKDWEALEKGEVIDWYKKLNELLVEYWALATQLDYFDYCGEKLIEEYVHDKRISIHRSELDKLSAPRKINYLQQMSLDIYAVVQNLTRKKLTSSFAAIKNEKDWSVFSEKQPEIAKKVQAMFQNYYWYRNTWGSAEELDIIHFVDEIQRAIKKPFEAKYIEDIKNYEYFVDRSCREIFKKYDMTSEAEKFFTFMASLGDWRDERKIYTLKTNRYLQLMVRALATKNQVSYSLFKYATGQEIINSSYDISELSERSKETMCLYNKKGEYGYVYGKEVQKILDIVNTKISGQDLRGSIACKGKARGFVKVILGKDEFHKMKQGDILVAIMTRPEYVPLMKKAGAIITDEGGIASHASIVSRELGVPCIVGTQQGTMVLKDGMEVEVNANHGLIKVLDKQ